MSQPTSAYLRLGRKPLWKTPGLVPNHQCWWWHLGRAWLQDLELRISSLCWEVTQIFFLQTRQINARHQCWVSACPASLSWKQLPSGAWRSVLEPCCHTRLWGHRVLQSQMLLGQGPKSKLWYKQGGLWCLLHSPQETPPNHCQVLPLLATGEVSFLVPAPLDSSCCKALKQHSVFLSV